MLPPKRTLFSALVRYAARIYRVGLLVAIVWVIHYHHAKLRIDGDDPIRLDEIRKFIPAAARFEIDQSPRQGHFVFDAQGQRVGYVVRTTPMCDDIVGYSGPTDTLITLDAQMRVLGITVRATRDTMEHLQTILEDETSSPTQGPFIKTWDGKNWEQVAGFDPALVGLEGVSGASQSSLSIASAIQQRFKRPQLKAAIKPLPMRVGVDDWGVAILIVCSLGFAFGDLRSYKWVRRPYQALLILLLLDLNGRLLLETLYPGKLTGWMPLGWFTAVPFSVAIWLNFMSLAALAFSYPGLRTHKWIRHAYQVGLIVYLGILNGNLLAQSLYTGWAANTIPWRFVPGLVLLAATALVIPWGTRRAIYCSQICPHGAAQELLGALTRRRLQIKLPRGIDAGMRRLPFALLAMILVFIMLNLPTHLEGTRTTTDVATTEPFDAYAKVSTLGWFANSVTSFGPSWPRVVTFLFLSTTLVALVGLIASLFVPMAYCKYGCPSGALFGFVRSHGKADGFGMRDLAATLLLFLAYTLSVYYHPIHQWVVNG